MVADNPNLAHPVETKVFFGIVYSIFLTRDNNVRIRIEEPNGFIEEDAFIPASSDIPVKERFAIAHRYVQLKIKSARLIQPHSLQ